jgi:hypothetical protein
MERTIELPKRADNHIRETTGYKVLESLIPAEWIIRSVSERDYGVDCYIELVDDDNHLTGDIAFVQMKATDKIDWRIRDNGFKFYKVDRSTTNYLSGFIIPTYLFLVDLSTKEMFFLSVKEYVTEHYREYTTPGTFAYEFSHASNLFSVDAFLKSFRRNNQYEQFRNELQYFISNVHHYVEFMWEHNNRDCFMQIEIEDMMFFEALHRNITFLHNYFGTTSSLPAIEELDRKGKAKYGDAYEQTLFDGVLTVLFSDFKASVLEIVDFITELVLVKEKYYWLKEKNYIFNYFNNLDKQSLFS